MYSGRQNKGMRVNHKAGKLSKVGGLRRRGQTYMKAGIAAPSSVPKVFTNIGGRTVGRAPRSGALLFKKRHGNQQQKTEQAWCTAAQVGTQNVISPTTCSNQHRLS